MGSGRQREFTHAMATGHRPQHCSTAQAAFARRELVRVAARLRDDHGCRVGISGMALGADLDWADAVVGGRLDLWAYIPFPQQADRWPPQERERWGRLRAAASREVVAGDVFDIGHFHDRNARMLADCDVVVAVWRPSVTEGGTASTVTKATAMGVPMVVIDLDQLRTYRSGQWSPR